MSHCSGKCGACPVCVSARPDPRAAATAAVELFNALLPDREKELRAERDAAIALLHETGRALGDSPQSSEYNPVYSARHIYAELQRTQGDRDAAIARAEKAETQRDELRTSLVGGDTDDPFEWLELVEQHVEALGIEAHRNHAYIVRQSIKCGDDMVASLQAQLKAAEATLARVRDAVDDGAYNADVDVSMANSMSCADDRIFNAAFSNGKLAAFKAIESALAGPAKGEIRKTMSCYWSPTGEAFESQAVPGACSCEPSTGLPSELHKVYVALDRVSKNMLVGESTGDVHLGEWAEEVSDAMDMLLATRPAKGDSNG